MIGKYGIAFVGIAAKRTEATSPLPPPKFRWPAISARDISKTVGGSKYVDMETTAGVKSVRVIQ